MSLNTAAITIQSAFRGYLVRKHFPSKWEREQSVALVEDRSQLSCTPTASSGVNTVYSPRDLPIVIKHLGYERAGRRFRANWDAAHLKYACLIVPKCIRYRDFTIEQKLPVEQATLRSQTTLYVRNLAVFSRAARDFTDFLLKIRLDDFVTTRHPFKEARDIPLARHDNIPLMIEDGVGKVALIDLGGYQLRKIPPDKAACVKIALALFPHHLDEICHVAEVDKADFLEISQKTQALFKRICS